MKLEVKYTIENDKASYTFTAGEETMTCGSKINSACFFLFCKLVATLNDSWKDELAQMKQEVLIKQVIDAAEKESKKK